jgi:hypothetical protein
MAPDRPSSRLWTNEMTKPPRADRKTHKQHLRWKNPMNDFNPNLTTPAIIITNYNDWIIRNKKIATTKSNAHLQHKILLMKWKTLWTHQKGKPLQGSQTSKITRKEYPD